MANLPSFNPNAVESGQRESHRNRAVTDLIEPGSPLKPLTVAAALEAGAVTPDTIIDTNPGWIPHGRYRTTPTRHHGVPTVTGVLHQSTNLGAWKIVAQTDNTGSSKLQRRSGSGVRTAKGCRAAAG